MKWTRLYKQWSFHGIVCRHAHFPKPPPRYIRDESLSREREREEKREGHVKEGGGREGGREGGKHCLKEKGGRWGKGWDGMGEGRANLCIKNPSKKQSQFVFTVKQSHQHFSQLILIERQL